MFGVYRAVPEYGSRDEYTGSRLVLMAGPFANTEAAQVAKGDIESDDDFVNEVSFYVANTATPWNPICGPVPATPDEDLPF